jgi:hypothetical protein
MLGILMMWGGVPSADAQGAAKEPRWYASVDGGATFGHKVSGVVGGEGGFRIADDLDVYVEGGRMHNVANSNLANRANLIASTFGGSANAAYRVTYFDAGLRYEFLAGKWLPYVMMGGGIARVHPDVKFSIGGTDVTGQLGSFGVQLGNDLADTLTKGLFVIGGGARTSFGRRYLVDVSYRYGLIFTRQGEIDNDSKINTNRLQGAFGLRF